MKSKETKRVFKFTEEELRYSRYCFRVLDSYTMEMVSVRGRKNPFEEKALKEHGFHPSIGESISEIYNDD